MTADTWRTPSGESDGSSEVPTTRPLSASAPSSGGSTLLARLAHHRRDVSPLEMGEELGRGGMGRVIAVNDKDLRRTIALKLLRDPSGDPERDAELRERFLQEAQITAQLDHPGIPPIHELGVMPDGQVFYTMPKLRGKTLAAVFDECWRGEKAWSIERCLGALLQVCETLAFAHSRGVIHRDIKPANVMVGEYGEVLVIDWGLARVLGEQESDDRVWTDRLEALLNDEEALLVTSPKGTPGYMAPELLSFSARVQDARVDVYAVGAMLYLQLGKVVPHKAAYIELQARRVKDGLDDDEFLKLLRAVLAEPVRPIAELAPKTPPELAAICAKALAPDRRQRYADMRALAGDLRNYLEVRPVRAYRTGAWVEFTKWIQRNRGVASLAAVLLVGALGASVGGMYLQRERAHALASEAVALKGRAVEAEAKRDRERNLTGAVLLDSVLSRTRLLFAAPSQLDELRTIRHDGEFLKEQALDLPRRLDALRLTRERTHDPVEVQDLDVQVAELERQSKLLPDLTAALATLDKLEQRITSESRFRPDAAAVRAQWDRTLTALASDPRFAGASVAPRDDLLPLGPVEPAGLWSFLALESADFSTPLTFARADEVGPERGLILLLIPGGPVRVGARRAESPEQIDDPHRDMYGPYPGQIVAPNDPKAAWLSVDLAPYYIGRYEVTRAQWQRIMGEERGKCKVPEGADPGRLPVELVSRNDSMEFARRLGLQLPTEVQWETAYRGGTTTPTFIALPYVMDAENGDDYDWRELAHYANFLDRTALDASVEGATRDTCVYQVGEPDDGYINTAPVGSFSPNPFGLFDMAGNVWEWCRDDYGKGFGPVASGDGSRTGKTDPEGGVLRGGSWMTRGDETRAVRRFDQQPALRDYDVGLRVALLAR